jgi:hypothetical protein
MKLIHAHTVGLLLAVMLFGAPLTSWAQGAADANKRTYGTKTSMSHTVGAGRLLGSMRGTVPPSLRTPMGLGTVLARPAASPRQSCCLKAPAWTR